MKIYFYQKLLVLLCLLVATILSACQCHVEEPKPLEYNYMNVPEDDTAIVEDLNITGMGARRNNKNTTWIIMGNVVMDHLDILGNVVVDRGKLTVLGTLDIKPTGTLIVNTEVAYKELKQSGKMYYHGRDVK